ncbi:MAG: hypothetical protein WC301_02845 [Candidatus Omnitrophota bacterium]|jgi:hydrogenase maturation protein HypF
MEFDKIKLPFLIKKPILALGPQIKNRVCFAKGRFAHISALNPDLSHAEDHSNFEKAAGFFLKSKPAIIAYDLHPEYHSTKYALGLGDEYYTLYPVQHHHAHIASCMVENCLGNEKVIGVAFDGTGFGEDSHLWGAEFLVCDYGSFRRAASLKEIPLLGGEMAIREPARVLAAWLFSMGKSSFLNNRIKGLGKNKLRVLKNMYLTGFNSPLSSSIGRLFDAAGSLVLGREKACFEAELAIELQELASRFTLYAAPYNFNVIRAKGRYIIDPSLIINGMIIDMRSGGPRDKIAYRFHLSVADMVRRICLKLKIEHKTDKVVLSGGVFQNNLLLSLVLDLLYKEDFRVLTHKILPPNDSCIALGQAAAANFAR